MGFIAKRLVGFVAALVVVLGASVGASAAAAAGPAAWSVRDVASPSQFAATGPVACSGAGTERGFGASELCDRYSLLVGNIGSEGSSGTVTLTDTLPAGIVATGWENGPYVEAAEWGCSIAVGGGSVTCMTGESVPAGGHATSLYVTVSAPEPGTSGSLRNIVSVTGGGAAVEGSAVTDTPISSDVPPFGVNELMFAPALPSGASATQAGGHPWTLTANIGLTSRAATVQAEGGIVPIENMKNVALELPLGFVGDPQSLPQCEPEAMRHGGCPAGSVIGSVAFVAGVNPYGAFRVESAIYNLVPVTGYPAELGFLGVGHVPVYLYASVVHGPSGYRLRVASPGIPPALVVSNIAATLFGVPGQLNGTASTAAFLNNPVDCSAGALTTLFEAESWEDPGRIVSKETTSYPQLTGCEQLRFKPTFTLAPSSTEEGGSTQADEPSAYTVDLAVPQTSDSSELSTPPLKDVTATLPAGLSLSPSAAQGLVGCQATGPEGINLGSSQVALGGRDEGDPEATELGEGDGGGPGGNGSPYDDGLYHLAPGHCPAASTIGTVEAFTPVLPDGPDESAPVHGHIYLASPKCGGSGQPECTAASATNGELFSMYLELAGDGVIVKLPGSVSADPATGQITASFNNNPQLPISDVKLHFQDGPRAPLANPQACGAQTTTADLTPWSAPQTPDAISTSSFDVDWDGQGGACPASPPFAPSFTAGTVSPTAGAFSPLTLTFSRQDREQDLAGLTLHTPPGLLGVIAQIPLCGEPQAAQGTCPAASRIGSATVASGAGPQPLWLSGQVYLTSGYNGRPFGLSIVTPADAGPFHLGNVVVRASIAVDPNTAALTIVSDPLPQIVDGVPLRLRTVNVTVDRPGFMFNPTDCDQQQITGTFTAAQGASAAVSSQFTASGCKTLPFKPSFSATTQANGTQGGNGASLDVKIAAPGQGPSSDPAVQPEANIRKVDVSLPLALSSRLATLNKACTEAQFAADPAGCPAASAVGHAVAHTPVLPVALEGPAYLVSHGGAAYPDLDIVLQGDGVTVVLTGNTQIKKGITYSKFETAPDVPISSFELNLPEGKFSILGAITNLCKPTTTVMVKRKGKTVSKQVPESLIMPTSITGQNGAVLTQSTKISVTGCKQAVRPVHKKTHKKKNKKKKK